MEDKPGMSRLVAAVNEIQRVSTELGLDLNLKFPMITVIGSQSAGKSSVLESFVGAEILPRGSGIVTRRPLILQLVTSESIWGEFSHLKGTKFTDFFKIREEIEKETDRLTGSNKGISKIPIYLRIFSPQVLNLTLVDLPGIARIPIGDQPKNIEQQIREMILEYITPKEAIILAVSSANCDLAVSDSIMLAKSVDPEGDRTIGVLTKLDLMDKGTDALDILENRIIKLKLGYVGVVNRSQSNINSRMDMNTAISLEQQYFREHQVYRTIAHKHGTRHLQHVLSGHLEAKIEQYLPELQTLVHNKYLELEMMVAGNDESCFMEKLFKNVRKMKNEIESCLYGTGPSPVNTTSLDYGAQIKKVFQTQFHDNLCNAIAMDDSLVDRARFAIQNIHAIRCCLFAPDKAYADIVRSSVDLLKDSCMLCLKNVVVILNKAIAHAISKIADSQLLCDEMRNVITSHARKLETKCTQDILFFLECQKAHIDPYVAIMDLNLTEQDVEAPTDISIDNSVVSAGFMFWVNSSKAKEYYFVLTNNYFQCFKDSKQDRQVFSLSVSTLNFNEVESKKNSSNKILVITDTRSSKQTNIELSCQNYDLAEKWKNAFTQVGIPTNQNDHFQEPSVVENDKLIQTQKLQTDEMLAEHVEKILLVFKPCMQHIQREAISYIPKIITLVVIDGTMEYIDTALPIYIFSKADTFKASPAQIAKIQADTKLFNACKKSLQIINDLSGNLNKSQQAHQSIPKPLQRTRPPVPPSRPKL